MFTLFLLGQIVATPGALNLVLPSAISHPNAGRDSGSSTGCFSSPDRVFEAWSAQSITPHFVTRQGEIH